MKIHELERLSPVERRTFMRWLARGSAALGLTATTHQDLVSLVGGRARAQAIAPTYFIEINLRDQWDQAHVMVAPSLATDPGLPRGNSASETALHYRSDELVYHENHRAYLTDDSQALAPHLDHIAMVDTCNPSLGEIHGHESANPIRSPGRQYGSGAGKTEMWLRDKPSKFPGGNEAFYSSTPTPACLHNHVQHAITPGIRNGITFKGISRSIHTAYHFGAGLANAEIDRIRSKDELFSTFPNSTVDLNVLSERNAAALQAILSRMDKRDLIRRGIHDNARAEHERQLVSAQGQIYVSEPKNISLPLDQAEAEFWGSGVPNQVGQTIKAQIWEQTAYAYKLIAGGLVRTVSLEFDYVDVHAPRTENIIRTMAKQAAIPLARLVQRLKETPHGTGSLFDSTLIAMYTTDGSRSPKADASYGDTPDAKNTLILAGGMIKGGYYGDYSGRPENFVPHAPDVTTGAPMAGQRTRDQDAWMTVATALGIDRSTATQFPDVADGRALEFLLR